MNIIYHVYGCGRYEENIYYYTQLANIHLVSHVHLSSYGTCRSIFRSKLSSRVF